MISGIFFAPKVCRERQVAKGRFLQPKMPNAAWSCPRYAISDGDLLSLTSFCSLPSHSSHHPSKPHQIKQSLSKIAVNERAVGKRQSIFQNRWSGYLLHCKLLLYLQRRLATFRTAKGRPDIALSGQYPILPWTIANIGRWNNRTNVTPEFNYT